MTHHKKDITGLLHQELAAYMVANGEKPFRATQIFQWIYQKAVTDFRRMANLPAGLIGRLEKDFIFPQMVLLEKHTSADGTTKFLFRLHDNERIETVLIPAARRSTVCISTQVGCKFRCGFCASGLQGWKRNLSCAEIVGQVCAVKQQVHPRPVTHVVVMGIGEPFDNYDNTLKAIRIINASQALNIAARRITVSTCGLTDGIKKFAQEGIQVELSVSLHGSNDAVRSALMPVNKRYPLQDVVRTCAGYVRTTKRQVTFEYIMIRDMTCTDAAARELGRLLKGMMCKLNLIPYNSVSVFDYRPPSSATVARFQKQLKRYGVHATLRTARGTDIAAACGQLKHTARARHR